jgi:hypothetical protein
VTFCLAPVESVAIALKPRLAPIGIVGADGLIAIDEITTGIESSWCPVWELTGISWAHARAVSTAKIATAIMERRIAMVNLAPSKPNNRTGLSIR